VNARRHPPLPAVPADPFAACRIHTARCKTCTAAYARCDTGWEAFHAMCDRGKAKLLDGLPAEKRPLLERADRVLTELDAERRVAS
jgi:hypothetical protein